MKSSAWDNADFVKAVEATGRKTLVMAGVWTSVCVAFPALQAKADGYKVYAVMDASGDISDMAFDATLARMTQAGIVPVTTNTILSETHRTWNRPDAAQWGALYAELVPNYRAVAESYKRAQDRGDRIEEVVAAGRLKEGSVTRGVVLVLIGLAMPAAGATAQVASPADGGQPWAVRHDRRPGAATVRTIRQRGVGRRGAGCRWLLAPAVHVARRCAGLATAARCTSR